MRRMMAQQAELAKARGETVEETETSQSEWSDDNEDMDGVANVPHDELPMNRDMSTSAVVTDVDDRGHDGDMDDTSMSSRGSPRLVNPKNEM